jgi:hypothetical protein
LAKFTCRIRSALKSINAGIVFHANGAATTDADHASTEKQIIHEKPAVKNPKNNNASNKILSGNSTPIFLSKNFGWAGW